MAQTKTFFSKSPVEEYENDIYAVQENKRPCAICGKVTSYKSKLAADYICSHECSKTLWYDIFVKLHTDRRRKK
jgi:alpha-D-ribose 1-methylphosphonate 5-phosphate C-P lyase